MASPNTICPPTDCPAHLLNAVTQWQLEPRNLLSLNRVPWSIQAAMATETYTTLSDLANRWCDAADLWANAARDYQFRDGDHGFDAATSKRALVGLKQTVAAATLVEKERTKLAHNVSDRTASEIMTPGHRESLETLWEHREKEKPPIGDQGSDTMLGRVYKHIHRGAVPMLSNKEIVSEIPDCNTPTRRMRARVGLDGSRTGDDWEEREPPSSWDAWRKQTGFPECAME